jgi:adenylate kinase
MRVAVTGTPGTGKTSAVDLVDADLPVVHLNELVREESLTTGRDDERDTLVADLDAVRERLADRTDLLVESHLAHHLEAARVVVLRCHPEELRERLAERDEAESKIRENAESEAVDVVLSEAVRRHGSDAVYEVDTTGRDPATVARDVERVVAGERPPEQGTVDFTDAIDVT